VAVRCRSMPGPGAARLRPFGTTIFAEMSALAAVTGSVNLGQGFPDTDGPSEVVEVAVRALRDGRGNQYPPGPGVAELRRAIVEHQRRWYGIDLDPDAEVLVTVGATEAIAAAVLGLCDPGDEVVMLEPYYDSYAATVAMAGAERRTVPLPLDGGPLDEDHLRAAVGERTRLLLLNTPHNPTGRVLTVDELAAVAEVAIERDLVVVADEVYEHLAYDRPHVPISTLPGMAERTLTISSAGKTFSFTGWKVGWVSGPAELVAAVRAAKQFLTYVGSGPLQHAVAEALALPDRYFADLRASMAARRDQLVAGLRSVGFDPVVPEGGYFVTTDVRDLGESDGMAFCRSLPERCGVVAIPMVVFFDDVERGRPLVRWACCKRPEVIDEAMGRLARGLGGPGPGRVGDRSA